MQDFYGPQAYPTEFVNIANFFMLGKERDPQIICKKNMKYRALVTFQLATDTVTLTTRTQRMSFFDKLSGFGNTC